LAEKSAAERLGVPETASGGRIGERRPFRQEVGGPPQAQLEMIPMGRRAQAVPEQPNQVVGMVTGQAGQVPVGQGSIQVVLEMGCGGQDSLVGNGYQGIGSLGPDLQDQGLQQVEEDPGIPAGPDSFRQGVQQGAQEPPVRHRYGQEPAKGQGKEIPVEPEAAEGVDRILAEGVGDMGREEAEGADRQPDVSVPVPIGYGSAGYKIDPGEGGSLGLVHPPVGRTDDKAAFQGG